MILMALAVLLVGCGQAPQEAPAASEGESSLSSFDTLAEAMEAGRGVYCSGTQKTEGRETQYEFWAQNGRMRSEAMTEQGPVAIIATEDTVYMQIPSEETECDWLSMSVGSAEDEGDMTAVEYEAPEDVALGDYDCEERDIQSSRFDVSGEVCSFEDMMAGFQDMPSN